MADRTTVYVPRDSAACSVGADEVAAEARAALRVTESGWYATVLAGCCGSSRWSRSRRPRGGSAYGPVRPEDVPGLMATGLLGRRDHPLRLAPTTSSSG